MWPVILGPKSLFFFTLADKSGPERALRDFQKDLFVLLWPFQALQVPRPGIEQAHQAPSRPSRTYRLGLADREKVLNPGLQVFWVHERPFSTKIRAYRLKKCHFSTRERKSRQKNQELAWLHAVKPHNASKNFVGGKIRFCKK